MFRARVHVVNASFSKADDLPLAEPFVVNPGVTIIPANVALAVHAGQLRTRGDNGGVTIHTHLEVAEVKALNAHRSGSTLRQFLSLGRDGAVGAYADVVIGK